MIFFKHDNVFYYVMLLLILYNNHIVTFLTTKFRYHSKVLKYTKRIIMKLYDSQGQRLYLTSKEREDFLKAALKDDCFVHA